MPNNLAVLFITKADPRKILAQAEQLYRKAYKLAIKSVNDGADQLWPVLEKLLLKEFAKVNLVDAQNYTKLVDIVDQWYPGIDYTRICGPIQQVLLTCVLPKLKEQQQAKQIKFIKEEVDMYFLSLDKQLTATDKKTNLAYKGIKSLKKIMSDKISSPSKTLSLFKNEYYLNKKIFETQKDSVTKRFLKAMKIILTLGIATFFKAGKNDGFYHAQNIDEALQVNPFSSKR